MTTEHRIELEKVPDGEVSITRCLAPSLRKETMAKSVTLEGSKVSLIPGREVDRTIHLRCLQQFETYRGLLEGLPTREMNARIVQRLVDDHRDKPYQGTPYLIQAEQKPIDYDGPGGRYPFGKPAALPTITCVAQFESLSPARDNACDGSGLVVIWFQNEFAFPIDEDVLRSIRTIPWNTVATDYDY